MYTNSWDPNNGQILSSTDQGKTFTATSLPFKVGGNMPGRGMGEVPSLLSLLSCICANMACSVLPLTLIATTFYSLVLAAETDFGKVQTLAKLGQRFQASLMSVSILKEHLDILTNHSIQ